MKTSLLISAMAFPGCLSAAVVFTGAELSYDFSSFDASTTGPADWDSDNFGTFRGLSAGGENSPGTYSFDVSNGGTVNRALGIQPSGSFFNPGYFQLEVQNNSGAEITDWKISFDVYVLNDERRSHSFDFEISTDGTNFTPVSGGAYTSGQAADSSPSWTVGLAFDDSIATSVADGSSLYLRWTGAEVGGQAGHDEFALDNVTVVPEPSTVLLAGLSFLFLGRRRH